MKTILYNTTTNFIIGHYPDGYKVDGVPQEVQPPIYELSVIEPEAPTITDNQVLSSEWVVDLINETYTKVHTVRDKTEEELIAEKEALAQSAEETINAEEVKKLLRLTADTLPEADLYQYPSVYPAWKPGIQVYDELTSPSGVADKLQYKGKLYKVVQGHITQLDWTPDLVPALFTAYLPPDVIPEWKQPTGAQDAYNIGDKVRFEGHIYESLINKNV